MAYNQTLKIISDTVTQNFNSKDFFSLSGENIRQELDRVLKRTVSCQGGEFNIYFDKWIEKNEKIKGYDTIKSWKTLKNKLPENLTCKFNPQIF